MLEFKERELDYFNSKDTFICYDAGIKNLFLSKLHLDKGSWWTNESLKFKASSIGIQNTNEIYHKEIFYKGIPLKGKVIKFLEPKNIGIIWDSGKQIKEFGLPPFWNDLYNLKLL